jgi:hypothetical protein
MSFLAQIYVYFHILFRMKTASLMAAMLAVATVIAVGLTILPSSVQEAQANPCSTTSEQGGGPPGPFPPPPGLFPSGDDIDLNCDFENGNFEITENDLGILFSRPP